MPSASESAIQRVFVTLFRQAQGDLVGGISVPNESPRSARYGAQLKAQGLTPGAADFLVWWSDGFGAGRMRMLWLEFKAERGRQTDSQRAFEDKVTAQGCGYAVVRSPEEAFEAIEARGAPLARVIRDGRLMLREKAA